MMQVLEIFDAKRWTLLISRKSEVKRKAKEGGRDRKQTIYLKQNMNKKWDPGYKKEMWVAWTKGVTTELEIYGGH